MGLGPWVALVAGLAGGAAAATWYWMANQPPTGEVCNCPEGEVCPVAGSGGICPSDYEPDPHRSGCCMPVPIGGEESAYGNG